MLQNSASLLIANLAKSVPIVHPFEQKNVLDLRSHWEPPWIELKSSDELIFSPSARKHVRNRNSRRDKNSPMMARNECALLGLKFASSRSCKE